MLAGGSTTARNLPIPGRELDGIHQAMASLPWSNHTQEDNLNAADAPISAAGRKVVIIGGDDTGTDCLRTSHRHSAASVHQCEIMPNPADERTAANPWPTWPMVLLTSYTHEEGDERVFSVNTRSFLGDDQGRVRSLQAHEVEFVDGHFRRDDTYATSEDEVWVCGDMGRGQNLIVWAIAESRACATAVDTDLMGASALPVPVPALARTPV